MTVIIAEIGNTHEGSIFLAKKMMESAARCGADIIKFQTHIFDSESLDNALTPYYFSEESRKSYLNRTSFKLEELIELKKHCEENLGKIFMSSSFSIDAINLLEKIDVKYHKVPSGEVNNLPFLIRLAETNKPIILSSGMSYLYELDKAVETLKENGCPKIILLQCTSAYPSPPEKSGLRYIREFKERYNLEIGLSDHTLGNEIAFASVALGAKYIEKHFTLSKEMYGSDAHLSSEPKEFKALVDGIRIIDKAVSSNIDKDEITKSLNNMKETFEKYIVTKIDLKKDTIIKEEYLDYKKSSEEGILAYNYKEILGKKLKTDILKNNLIKKNNLV